MPKKLVTKEQARKIIEDLVKLLNASCPHSRHVYDILAALRGPDKYNETLKYATTAKVRGAIGLKHLPSFRGGTGVVVNKKFQDIGDWNNLPASESSHFSNHIIAAVDGLKALGFLK